MHGVGSGDEVNFVHGVGPGDAYPNDVSIGGHATTQRLRSSSAQIYNGWWSASGYRGQDLVNSCRKHSRACTIGGDQKLPSSEPTQSEINKLMGITGSR